MPTIPITTPLSYLGVLFMVFGFFLFIAGTGIISVEKISVKPGRLTLVIGIVMVLVGFLFLSPTISDTIKSLSPTPTLTSTPFSIANSTPTETKRPISTPSPTTTSNSILCVNSPKRLQVNQYALVATQIDSLLLRDSPGNTVSYLEKLPPQTKIFVLEEPVCADYKGTFFWWWKVQSPSGTVGWIVEGYDSKDSIFVKPAP